MPLKSVASERMNEIAVAMTHPGRERPQSKVASSPTSRPTEVGRHDP